MDCKRIRSSPSSQRMWEHDVFLSFRGEDTRYSFTDHLFAALQRKGIFTFKDDVKVQQGEAISPQLLKAIEKSRIFIVVFSANYANSTWCLEELAEIASCIKESGTSRAEGIESMEQTVFPVFYNVNPSDVRKQSGDFEKVFANLEIRFKESSEKVQRWRAAMTKVANICGWHVHKKPESNIIDEIVKQVTSILGHEHTGHAEDLVGIQSRAKELESLLNLGSKDDVRVVGVCGMAGIGKTTLASVVYDRIYQQFNACSFLLDVRKVNECYGVVRLQEQLLCETVNEENIKIWNSCQGGKLISKMLHHLKTLIVFDDVDDEKQLETLVGNRCWFGTGSRIIITSRNEKILRQYGVDKVYKVELLNDHEALELLCTRAFRNDKPLRGYEKLTYCALQYVKGLPLAIKVVGSSLFGANVSQWTSFLNRMQEFPEKKIMDVLRTSLDGLVESNREIFLDIACFFNGKEVKHVNDILECCGFHPKIGIKELIDRSLLSILKGKYIQTHDLLQELGKQIVQENYPDEPERWSRLWLYKDFQHVLMRNEETKYVNAIVVELEDTEEIPLLRVEGLSNLRHLRLLILRHVKFSGSLHYFPIKIKYLSWYKYPFAYFPSNFQSESSIMQGKMPFHNMRSLNLAHSKALMETPNFSWLPNLEKLVLQGCTKLSKIHVSIRSLHKLALLDLRFCKNLVGLPNNLSTLSSLDWLSLKGCSKIKRTPNFRELPNLRVLSLQRCASLLDLDDSIRVLSRLKFLNLNECKNLACIPSSFSSLSSLKTLGMSGCPKLVNVSEETRHAEGLDESVNKGESIPCIVRKTFKPIGLSLASLSTQVLSLTDLDLRYCNICEVPNSIGDLHCLERLFLDGNNFITLPCTIKNLYELRIISLNQCKNLESLPELPQSILASLKKRGTFSLRSVGLHIFDCPKVVKNESCSVFALSWFKRLLQVRGLYKLNIFLDFVIPGSEIPRWFEHHSSTPSIRIQVPPNVKDRDNNRLGFTVCVTFVVHNLHLPTDGFRNTIFFICCYLNGQEKLCLGIPDMRRRIAVEVDHLWLVHFWRNDISFEMMEENKFIQVEFKTQPGVEVKKCAMHWTYKESVERMKPRIEDCTSNNMQIDNDDQQQHVESKKKLRMEKRRFGEHIDCTTAIAGHTPRKKRKRGGPVLGGTWKGFYSL